MVADIGWIGDDSLEMPRRWMRDEVPHLHGDQIVSRQPRMLCLSQGARVYLGAHQSDGSSLLLCYSFRRSKKGALSHSRIE